MATHSSILAWTIPWTEEPGGLQSGAWRGQKSIGHDCLQLSMHTCKPKINCLTVGHKISQKRRENRTIKVVDWTKERKSRKTGEGEIKNR